MPQAIQLPKWIVFVRVSQAVLAFITLGLTAFAASVFGVFSGFALEWFVCFWTVAFLAFTLILRPRLKVHHLIPLIPEIATAFWWLVTLGLLASEASALSGLQALYNAYIEDATNGAYTYTFGTTGNAALGCTKAAAVAAALEFVSFLATIGIYVATMLRANRAGNPNINMNYTGEPKQNFHQGQGYQSSKGYQNNTASIQA